MRKSLCKRYGKRVLAVLVAAAMVLPSNFGIRVLGNTETEAEAAEMTTLTDAQVNDLYSQYFNHKEYNRVTVHDPSIVVGYEKDGKVYGTEIEGSKKVYYIFGSHLAWAYSYDLENWTSFQNNLNTDYANVLEKGFEWAERGDSVYDPSGNMWAPDVLWDADYQNADGTKGSWLMYMSINGCSWNSVIVLLTAQTLNGDWTYQEEVVYSGFTNEDLRSFKDTDYDEVTGLTTLPDYYTRTAYVCKDNETACSSTTWNYHYGAHAIDPCVLYDGDDLWMSYGSWSGGIWMIKLDKETGLRDMNTTYTYQANVSDEYMGYKLAGGTGASGEASYIQKINGRYYIFLSYAGFVANGGYNMRIFSSDSITGPYKDVSGDDARFGSSSLSYDFASYPEGTYSSKAGNEGNDGSSVTGNRLMAYYKWSFMDSGFVAQGHNSAFVDSDGKAYVIYHTRFDNQGEGHQVRVHQLFTAGNGGLVAAPFEYSGETLAETAYANDEIAGTYRVIEQKSSTTDHTNKICSQEKTIELMADGTISGDYTGTWTEDASGPDITINIGSVEYQGVLLEQNIEGTDYPTLCFTVVGNNDISLWGYHIPEDKVVVAANVDRMSLPDTAYGDIDLPSADGLLWGAEVTWSSSNPEILSDTGVVTTPSVDTEVRLTATITKKNYNYQKVYTVTVCGDAQEKYDSSADAYLIASYFENDPQALAGHKDGDLSIDNPYNENNISGLDVSNGVMVQFDVSDVGAMSLLGTILGFMAKNGDGGRMYFTQGSYLGYNVGGIYFDANIKDWQLVNDYIGTGGTVQLKFTSTGFAVSVNGIQVYTESIISEGNGGASLTDYSDVLTWLNKTADKVYLGYGGWWADAVNCSISNLKFYVCDQGNNGTGVNPNDPSADNTDTAKSAGVLYAQNYENVSSILNVWSSTNASGYLKLASDTTQYGNYLDYSLDSGAGSGSRGAYSSFGLDASDLTEDYVVETDVYLNGTSQNSANAQFAITTQGYAYTSKNINYGLDSGYILKLSTANSTTWTVNDDSTNTVVIPVEWIHIKAEVDVSEAKAHIIMTGADVSYEEDVNINGSTAVDGLYILAGRVYGSNHVDNTYIYRTEMTTSDDNLSFAVNRVSYTANDDITYYDNPLYGQTVSQLSIEYTINWMVNAAKNGWDGVFSFYNSSTGGRVSVQTAPYVSYNNTSGSWLDLNNPNNTDSGANDIAPSLQIGKDHTVTWKITANNITVKVNGTKVGISEVTDNGCTNSDLLNFISTCDQFTLGVGNAVTAYWSTELCSISDLVISAQPTNNSVYIANDGQNAYGSVLKARVNTASESAPSYQWYTSTTENGTYSEINGATASTYVPEASDIGKYIKVKAVIDEEEVESTAVQITKRELIADVKIQDKTYDNTVNAEIASKELSGAANNDNVTYTVSAEFADANAGSSKDVIVTVTLDSTWQSCYELKETSFHKVAEIFKAVPVYETPTGLKAEIGDTLADITLPDGFSFEDALTTVLSEGKDYTVKVIYTPEDTVNYSTVENIDVTIHVHTWNAGETTKEATCTETGEKTYTCTSCQETKTEELAALGHDYAEEFTIDKEATCTEAGSKSRHCSRCDAVTDVTEIEIVAHTMDEGTVTLEPTCEETGTKVYKCTVCNQVLNTQEIPALGHDYAEEFTIDKEATCTEAGSKSRHCSRCDATTDVTEIPKLEHTSDEGTITVEPDCETEGTKVYKCSVCQEILKTEVVSALGHDWSEWVTDKEATVDEEGQEHRTCQRCQKEETHVIPKIETWEGSTEVSGDFIYGSVVSASAIVVGGLRDDVRLSYQWYRSDSASAEGTAIAGAAEGTYTLTKEDIGKYISVEISSESYIGSLTGSKEGPVQKRLLAIGTVSVEDKPYDATTTASIKELTFLNIAGDEEISYTADASFSSADASENVKAAVTVVLTGDSADCYILEINTAETTASITKIDPEYVLPTGLTAVYGDTLADVKLPEGFAFEDSLDTTAGDAGTNVKTVTYTPSDSTNYNVLKGLEVEIEVTPAVPSYQAPEKLAAVYGQTLKELQDSLLKDTGFTFEDPLTTEVGDVGTHSFKLTYTPEDTKNYQTVTGIEVEVEVSQASQDYEVPTGLTAVYGDTLADVKLPEGFTFEDKLTTSVGSAGVHVFTVTYTPTDENYAVVKEIEVNITVSKADPEYVLPTGLTAVYGTTLGAITLTEGFAFEDSLDTTVGDAGTNIKTVTYTPSDSANYNVLKGLEVEIEVTPAVPSYQVPEKLIAVYGQTLKELQNTLLKDTGFTFEDPLTTEVGDVGTHSFKLTYTPEDTKNYKTVTGIEVQVEVKAAEDYEVPTDLTAVYGDTLADVKLPEGFTFEDKLTTSVGSAGVHVFTVTYTPTDENYAVVTGIEVNITVSKADPEYVLPAGLAAVYGTTLGAITLPEGFAFEDSLDTTAGDVGTNVKTVTYTPSDSANYNVLKGLEVEIEVTPAVPSYQVPEKLIAVYGQTLKELQDTLLKDTGFTFEDPLTTEVGDVGTHSFKLTYTPEDTKNYNTITGIKVTITVAEKPQDNTDSNGTTNNGGSTSNNNGTTNNGSSTSNNNGTTNNGGSTSNNNSSTNNNGTENNNGSSGNTDTQNPSDNNNAQEDKPAENVVTETKPDGTKVETVTETQEDGTVKETVTETKTDGSVTETKEITTADNSAVLKTTVETDASGNTSANAVIRTGVSDTFNTIEIAESLLKDVAADDKIDRVIIEITDTTVNSAVSSSKKTTVNVNIPSVEGVEVEKVVLTKESIEAAKETGKGLIVNVINGDANAVSAGNYTVTIPVKQLAKIDSSIEEIDVTINTEKVANVTDTSKKNAIIKVVNSNNGKKKKTCVVSIASNEDVNAGMKVTISVTGKTNIVKGSSVYVYKYDAKTGKLIETANCRQTVSKDGNVVIAAASGTDYVVSAKKLSGNKVETITDNISISVSKKTAKSGKSVKVAVSLPETVSTKTKFGTEKATITYKSSDSKVASVSKTGAVTTKKKGTVTITTTVKLASGQKVVKKQKITVK